MRRLRILIVVTTAVVLLGACGFCPNNSEPATGSWPRPATGSPGPAAARIAAGRDATTGERTARFAYSVDGVGEGERALIGATGAVDFESGNLSVRLDVSGYGFGDDVDGSAEVRVVDGVFYLDLGDLGDAASELPEGARWLELDLGGLADALGAPEALMEPPDPLDGLEALRSLSDDVEEVGQEEVRGVETTHYRATLDVAGVVADAPFDVWLDAQGRVRKYTMRVDGSSSGASVAVTYELYDFGAPVAVDAPPADEVADLGSMLGELFDGFVDGLIGGSADSA